MSRLLDLGRRVELQSMDSHFHDITIALYRQEAAGPPLYTVHTYANVPGSAERIDSIVAGMAVLGNMQKVGVASLQFPCSTDHPLAARRVFLESCKLPPTDLARAPALNIVDRKSGLTITVANLGDGQYRVGATGDAEPGAAQRRVDVIVNGLRKLGELQSVADPQGQVIGDCISFDCGHDHDALVALLLQRAPNVRALVREEAAAAARGMLAAPSAQS